jgi:hypothetical protein
MKKTNKCISKKINKTKKKIIEYSCCEKSISIDKNTIDYYFDCYHISESVKSLCSEWILKKRGCFLDVGYLYGGTIYLTKTRHTNYNNHIHIFPNKFNTFTWLNKKDKKRGKCTNSKYIKKYIEFFYNLL